MTSNALNEIGRNVGTNSNSLNILPSLPHISYHSSPNKENICKRKLLHYNDEEYANIIHPLVSFIKGTGSFDTSVLPSLYDTLQTLYIFSRDIHSFYLMKQTVKQHLAVIGKLLISKNISILTNVTKFSLLLFNETNLVKVKGIDDILLQDFTCNNAYYLSTLKIIILQFLLRTKQISKYQDTVLTLFSQDRRYILKCPDLKQNALIKILLNVFTMLPDSKVLIGLKLLEYIEKFNQPFEVYIKNMDSKTFKNQLPVYARKCGDKTLIYRYINSFCHSSALKQDGKTLLHEILNSNTTSKVPNEMALLAIFSEEEHIILKKLALLESLDSCYILSKKIMSSETILLQDKLKYLHSFWNAFLRGNFEYSKKQQYILDQTLIFLNTNLKLSEKSKQFLSKIYRLLKEICMLHSDHKRLSNVINMSYNTFIVMKDIQFIKATINFEISKYLSFHSTSNINQTIQRLVKFTLCIPDSQVQLSVIRQIYSFYMLSQVDSLTDFMKICQTICIQLQKCMNEDVSVKLSYASEIQISIVTNIQNISASAFLSTSSFINILFFSSLSGNHKIIHEGILRSKTFKHHFLCRYERLLKLVYYLNAEMSKHQTINLSDITNNYLNKWMKYALQYDATASSIELRFLTSMVQYLHMAGFDKQILELHKSMVSHCEYYGSILNSSELWMLRSLVSLQLLPELQTFKNRCSWDHSMVLRNATFDDKLIYLDKCIELYVWQNNVTKFKQLFFSTLPKTYNEIFDIHNTAKIPITQYIQLLLFNVRLYVASSKIHSYDNDFIGTVVDAKKALKLSLSLIKKVDKLSQTSRLSVFRSILASFDNLIKQFSSLGLAKNAEMYIKELLRMLPNLSEPSLTFQCLCHLYYFYVLTEQEDPKNKILEKLHKIFNHIQGAHDINSLCHFLFINKQYDKIFVSLKIFFGNDTNQGSFLENYWRLQMGQTLDELTCLSMYKSINHGNKIQNQYENLLRDIETDPFFGTIFESALASPSAKIKDDSNANMDISKDRTVSQINNTPKQSLRSSNMTPKSKNTRQGFDRFVVTARLKQIMEEIQNTDLNIFSHVQLTRYASLYSLVFNSFSSINNNDPSQQQNLQFWFYISDTVRSRPLFYDKQLSSLDTSIYDEMSLYSSDGGLIKDQNVSWKIPYNFESQSIDFNIISIDVCSLTDSLILSKYNGDLKHWVTLRVPFKDSHARDTDIGCFSFANVFKEMNDIIKCNDMTTSSKITSTISTAEGRKNWWNKRYELDKRLEKLLFKITNSWIGGFKGFFGSDVIDMFSFEEFTKTFDDILNQFLPSRKQLSDSSKHIYIEDWILELFLRLDGNDSNYISQIDDLLFFIFDILLYHGEENSYDEIDITQMNFQITEAIKKYKTNSRQDIILNKDVSKQKKHTFLLVSSACHLFPWESLPFLHDASITRIPSLKSLDKLLMNNDMNLYLQLTLNDSIGMILNPNNDLNKTEMRFKDLFNKIHESTLNSKLLINEKPSELDFLSFIKESSLFIYVGHGSGEQYVRLTQIKSCDKVAASFLLGCSSAAMKYYGKLEPSGSIYSYLLAGSPLILGNLWDVTDKDIDKFSMALFEKTGISKTLQGEIAGYQTIPKAVANSRDSCHLKYMNGAAPVVYGLPIRFIQ